MKCSACGNPCRSTTTVHIARAGRLARVRVCAKCARNAITILAAESSVCACGSPATTCGPCAIDHGKKPDDWQRQMARKLEGLAQAYNSGELDPADVRATDTGQFTLGRVAGLEQAASILKKGIT